MYCLSILLFLLLFCILLWVQSDVQIKVYDFEDGLSYCIVLKILQDSVGFIWMVIINGFNWFDGYEFVIYMLQFFFIYLLYEFFFDMVIDVEQWLWLGSFNYIICFDLGNN